MTSENDIAKQLADVACVAYYAKDKAHAAFDLAYNATNNIDTKNIITDIKKDNIEINLHDINPEDYVEISHDFMPSTYDNRITVMSRSIKFKDLCKAIAIQIVKNDLDIEKEE